MDPVNGSFLLVADKGNSCIRKVALPATAGATATVTSPVGKCGTTGDAIYFRDTARFSAPSAIFETVVFLILFLRLHNAATHLVCSI